MKLEDLLGLALPAGRGAVPGFGRPAIAAMLALAEVNGQRSETQ
jgi:hypothetical protein